MLKESKGIRLEHISKIYQDPKTGKDFKAVDDANLVIEPGSFVTLLGPSGCGKTTTLRMIAGFESPDEGEIYLGDQPINELTPNKRDTAMVFQSYALFPHYNVFDNVAYGLKLRKLDKKVIHDKVMEILDLVELSGMEGRMTNQLSGGQQQRVALARMMIGEPEAILLDEPFSALDGYLKDVLQKDMQEFLKQYQGDMLMVTHSRDEAFRFCNELMLLKDGKTLIFGDTRKLFEQPQLLEAARLTGCKNSSRIERMGEYQVFALDWGISLRTEQKVELDMTHIAIRGHWIRPSEKAGENCLVFEAAEYVETTFEHQYLVKSPGMEDGAVLWWMRPKKSFTDEHDKNLPKYLYLPPEHLMLLK